MREKVRGFFTIPADALPAFWQAARKHNRLSLLVICIMIFGMELFNMARVLFWSSSGLGTLNNRIYFTLYLSLFLAAAVYLILDRCVRGRSTRLAVGVQYGAVLFFLLWHVCMNTYDLMRNPEAEVGIYYTAVLGLAVFILLPAWYSCIFYGVAYGAFIGLSGGSLSSGDLINITCTTIVALAVSLTSSHYHTTILSQRQEIDKMNRQLRDLARRDSLTGLLNKAAFQDCVEANLNTEGIALLILDLDNFKGINDQYGHLCGDYVLKEVALQIEAVFSAQALGIGRVGGDEFGILLCHLEGEGLEAAVQKLVQAVREISWRGRPLRVGCSLGGCRVEAAGVDYAGLYGRADRALYQAKNQGKGQFCLQHLP